MSEPGRWSAEGNARRRELLARLLALEGSSRERELDALTAGDAALRDDLVALLRAAEADDDDGPPRDALGHLVVSGAAETLGAAPAPPREVGTWTVLEKLGEGGMGVVWKARQRRPSRLAALKFLRLASATPDARRRLELEAEVLAQLQHPAIAQLYEVGSLDGPGGPQPYLAMELVEGEPLDGWVEKRGVPRAERLRLFLDLCAAVEHAHARGVIHRDLKPSNVLVREDGQLKVLDFGIARVVGAQAPGATPGTRGDAVLGTLAYMSPERLAGAPADTRSDVYALGAILHELLSGRLPLDVAGDPLPRALERIATEDPPRLGTLDPSLSGDLETIVATALAKEPARRYGTAAALADDVRRHLAHQPVRARAPSAWYVMSRFARRHRTVVSVLLVAAAGLVSATVLALAAARRADRERVGAERARATADAVADRAERDAYRARLAAAGLELETGDARAAVASLEAAPRARRGWEWDHFAARADESLRTFGSTSEAVLDAAFAEDADHVVLVVRARAGSTPARVRTVRWRDGTVVSERATMGAALLSADGTTVAESDEHERAVLLTRDGTPVGTWSSPDVGASVRPIATAPDGSGAVFVAATDPPRPRTVHVLRRGANEAQLLGKSGTYAALGPRCRHVVWLGRPNTWALSDLATGQRAWLELGPSVVRPLAFAFDADGRRLIAATSRSWLLWDVDAPDRPDVGPEAAGAFHGAALDTARGRATLVSRNGAVRVFDLARREQLRSVGGQGEVPGGMPCLVRPSRDGRLLLTSDGSGYVRLWDDVGAGATTEPDAHVGYVYAVATSPDGTRVASVGWDGRVVTTDVVSGRVVGRHVRPPGNLLLDVAWSPDGRRIAALEAPTTGEEHHVVLLDARTLTAVAAPIAVRLGTSLPFGGLFLRHLAYVPATGALFVARSDGLWTVPHGGTEARAAARAAPDAPWVRRSPQKTAVLAARGDLLVRVDGAGRLELRGGPDGDVVRVIETGVDDACELVLSADLSTAYLGTLSGRLVQVALGPGKVRAAPVVASGPLYAIALAPDGTRLFAGGEDGHVRVLTLPELETVAELRGHRSYVHALAVAAGGRVLVSGSGDNTVRLWTTLPRAARAAAAADGEQRRAAQAPRVEALLAGRGDPTAAADALEAAADLDRADRAAALDALVERTSPPR
ncbi:MAG: protein kinase [Planctomycetes bacterium]|nr:protein kinase [Planctomycetota bacterium]